MISLSVVPIHIMVLLPTKSSNFLLEISQWVTFLSCQIVKSSDIECVGCPMMSKVSTQCSWLLISIELGDNCVQCCGLVSIYQTLFVLYFFSLESCSIQNAKNVFPPRSTKHGHNWANYGHSAERANIVPLLMLPVNQLEPQYELGAEQQRSTRTKPLYCPWLLFSLSRELLDLTVFLTASAH